MATFDSDGEASAWRDDGEPWQDVRCPDFTAQLMGSSRVRDRIHEALAVLSAMSAGELLAALPTEAMAQRRHQTAVSLLGVLEVLLKDALSELED